MAEKVTLRLSAAAAAYVRGDAHRQEKLKAARGEVPFCASDLGTLLVFLSLDGDPEVKAAAVKSLREMPEELLTLIAGAPETHPRVLDLLARFHYGNGAVIAGILSNPAVETRTIEFLAAKGVDVTATSSADVCLSGEDVVDDDSDTEAVDEEDEEFKSKYKLCQEMGVADKIKLALAGDKEWRSMLLKDSNKLVSGAVIRNPRITEPEVLAVAKSKIQNDEILRLICMNKEWVKNYQIRKALVENHKTPLPKALRFMATLTDKDLAALAKSKNVVTAIATQARRMLLNKDKH